MNDSLQAQDYLTLKDAAAYVGVAPQTMRRWDASGKLKPIRHPSSGYRYYKRSDLEPFRLEYRRAEMDVVDEEHLFQVLPADVEGNSKLREPQRFAHRAARQHFGISNDHAIIQIPVGCGKTGVIATLPFAISKGRVLVITPNLTIRRGVADALDFSNPKNFWRKTGALHDFSSGPYRAVLDGVDANLHDCNESHIVVTNIQQLASSADRWLPQFPPNYFDMILVDEGHHNVAQSWTKVFERFPNAKVVSLTATPFRSDGVRPTGNVIYRYPFTRAMVNGYIKQIHSRNHAPKELYFTFGDDELKHSLEEVMQLRDEAWFRRGVALSPECNRHIVDASLKYLEEMRDRTGFRHQLIAVACSVDHARQVRSLYEERGYSAQEIHSDMDKDRQEGVLDALKRGQLDCIVQVQMLGEGFDHPPLSVAAIFRPFRSLSPYIQFIGRVMRVVEESKPDHPDNHAYIVSHVGLSNDEHWDDFRELDLDDQRMIREWISSDTFDGVGNGEPRARRFDDGMIVDDEIVGEFIGKSFLDFNDDRVLDELLEREIGSGIKLGSLLTRDELRQKLKAQEDSKEPDSEPINMPIQPQRRRVQARKRLNERAKSVANRVLDDLGISPMGRDVGKAIKSVAGQANKDAMITLMNRRINEHIGIGAKERSKISAEQAEDAYAALDMIGDNVRDEISSGLEE
ncbi:DEAD/DEAH box helicase family protein [Hoeflea sp.]|uniref:DEAD/DEAH box helicase family protein n=1 Tax=Hoeflea sp. TaxID=1940281 RepID=UPI003B014765